MPCRLSLLLTIAVCGCSPRASAIQRTNDSPRYLKGQLHAHSSRSGDSETHPLDVLRWYREHDYDFVVFTDHNRTTRMEAPRRPLAIAGSEITQNLETCDPAPAPEHNCLLHVNGLFLDETAPIRLEIPAPKSLRRADIYQTAIELAHQFGGLAQLNHPNFHFAADGALIAELAGHGLNLLEVANEALDSSNRGDEEHPSTEQLWDDALTRGARIWGVASDDAHHYYDADRVRAERGYAHTGDVGFVMVRAQLDRESIRAAVLRGDFYASNGVLLRRVSVDNGRMAVAVKSKGRHRIRFVGKGGRVLAEHHGRGASFLLSKVAGGYVRAVVEAADGKRAWVQPVFVDSAK